MGGNVNETTDDVYLDSYRAEVDRLNAIIAKLRAERADAWDHGAAARANAPENVSVRNLNPYRSVHPTVARLDEYTPEQHAEGISAARARAEARTVDRLRRAAEASARMGGEG